MVGQIDAHKGSAPEPLKSTAYVGIGASAAVRLSMSTFDPDAAMIQKETCFQNFRTQLKKILGFEGHIESFRERTPSLYNNNIFIF